MKRFAWLGAGLACWACAVWLARDGTPATGPTRFVRDLTRPVVLPALWNEIERAERTGDLARAATLGQELLLFFPEWRDGPVHFASRLAIDLGSRTADVDERLRLLETGLAWLDEARRTSPRERAAELAAAQGMLVQICCRQDPPLQGALRLRSGGRDPAEVALDYLDQALALAPPDRAQRLEERRAFLLVDVLTAAIRAGDTARARAMLDAAIDLLGRVRDADTSKKWRQALERVRPALGDEQLDLDSLAADPYLEGVVEALRASRAR